jgi:hypothetical protein
MATEPAYSLRVVVAAPPQGDGEPSAILDRLTAPNETIRQAISGGLLMLTGIIQKERFTGKGPFPVADNRLGVVTGRLRRDLHAEPATLTDAGYSGRIGSAVEYFGAHELGFQGEISVRAHVRAAHTLSERPISSKKGKVRVRPAQSRLEQSVRAHKRNVTIPARKPLRTGIEQHSMRVLGASISKAVKILTSTPSA